MRHYQSSLPPILAADAIGILLFGWMLGTLEARVLWLAYMVILNVMVYLVARDRSTIVPTTRSKKGWVIWIQRCIRPFEHKAPIICLIEVAFGLAGYFVGLDAFSWTVYMGIVNMLIFYWCHTRASRTAATDTARGTSEDRSDAPIKVATRARALPPGEETLWKATARLAARHRRGQMPVIRPARHEA